MRRRGLVINPATARINRRVWPLFSKRWLRAMIKAMMAVRKRGFSLNGAASTAAPPVGQGQPEEQPQGQAAREDGRAQGSAQAHQQQHGREGEKHLARGITVGEISVIGKGLHQIRCAEKRLGGVRPGRIFAGGGETQPPWPPGVRSGRNSPQVLASARVSSNRAGRVCASSSRAIMRTPTRAETRTAS